MARLGYARAGSIGQSLEAQIAKLSGCDEVFREQAGVNGRRPQLKACLHRLRRGDTLVVASLDKLARSALHLQRIHERLRRKGASLHVIEQQVDTSSASGKRLFCMLSLVVELEKKIRAERQAEGIARARERGVHFGRRAILSEDQAAALRKRRARGALIKTLMQDYGISKSTTYNYLASNQRSAPGRKFKLTTKQVVAMRQRYKQGVLIETLAEDYGITEDAVYRYLRRR